MVAVNLAPLEPTNREKNERTYTDNLSAHGARVRATYAWQLGAHAEITPASGEATVRGEWSIARDSTMIGFSWVLRSGKASSPGPSCGGLTACGFPKRCAVILLRRSFDSPLNSLLVFYVFLFLM